MSKKTLYGESLISELDLFADPLTISARKKEYETLKSMYDAYVITVPQASKVYAVTYLGSDNNFFLFDGSFKDYVRVENRQTEAKYLKNTEVGSMIDVLITDIDNDNFFITGSISELYETRARKNLTELEEGVSITGYVREMTSAGYNIDLSFEGVTLFGFMPNTLAGINKLLNPESILGDTFDVMIESFSKSEGTYIVSRRKYLQSLIPEAISKLDLGAVYTGFVTGTTDFGVFVEFNNCLTGMIHKTNINPEWADRISEIVNGQEIDFYVKEVIDNKKLILTQIIRDTLWDTIKHGQVMNGTVKDVKQFGALVILDDETNGLIHTSELEKHTRKLQAGEAVKVRVLRHERQTRKIFLELL